MPTPVRTIDERRLARRGTSRVRTCCVRVAAAALLVGSASAQWLDLESGGPPELGERSALVHTMRTLERDAGALSRLATDDELDGAAAEAKRAWRLLALGLLEAGGRMGEAGRVVTDGGLRIARELGALDAIAEYASGEGRVDDAERARVLVGLRASARNAARVEPNTIVVWDAMDEALRDVFLPLTPLPGAWGEREPRASWPPAPGVDDSPVDAAALRTLVDGAALSDGARAGAHGLIGALALAEASPARRASAREDAASLRAALEIGCAIDALPWRDEARAELWARAIDESLALASGGGGAAPVRTRLVNAATAAALAADVAEAVGYGVDARAVRLLHHAVDEALRTSNTDGASGVARLASATREALRDAAARRALVRETLGGGAAEWTRAMAQEGARVEIALLQELTDAAGAPGRMDQPAMISSIVNHRAVCEGTARVFRARRWASELGATGDNDASAAARSLAAIIEAHAPDATRAWAMRRLERFERVWDRRDALLPDERDRWLRAWAGTEGPSDDDARRLLFLLESRTAAGALRNDHTLGALRAWSALGFDPAAVRAEADALRVYLDEGRASSDQMRDFAALAHCLSALGALWKDEPRADESASDALGRLCVSPGRTAALRGSRDDLATLRRWFLEAARAHGAGGGGVDEVRAYLAPVCERLREDALRAAAGR